MNAPVDLTNLRSMTDGDKDMEKELFKEFYSSFEAGLNLLRMNCGNNAAEIWRKEAHALKGIALNLGAEKLGELCKNGQEQFHDGTDAKSALLKKIQAKYEQVKQFLLNVISGH